MYDKDFKVKLIGAKNSFLFLSEHDSRHIDHEHMIRLSYGLNKRAFFSLGTSMSSLKEGELAMCSVLAKELGIIRGDTVSLSTTPYIASIRRCKLLTASDDDYEVLGLLAETVQSTLLNQAKIVHDQQKLVIWITNAMHVTVVVDGVEPISPGKLEMLTEVAILPPQRRAASTQPIVEGRSSAPSGAQKASIMNAYNQTQCALRLHPAERAPSAAIGDKKAFIAQPFSALLSRRNFERLAGPYRAEAFALVTLRLLCLADDERAEDKMADVVRVSDDVFERLRVGRGARVLAARVPVGDFVPKAIEIVTAAKHFNKADELVRNYLCSFCQDGGRAVINSGLLMEEPVEKCRFLLKFVPANQGYLVISQRVMRECKFKLAEEELVEESTPKTEDKDKCLDLCLDASNYASLVRDIVNCIEEQFSSVILTGKPGSGKTSLIRKVAERLRTSASLFHVEDVQCRRMKGKSIESFLKSMNSIFSRLIYYQPSVLLLDDLHVICEKVTEGEQPNQENIYFNKLSDMLAQELEHLLSRNRIFLVATSESMSKLNQNVYSSRGKHLFKNCFSIRDLNKDDRTTALRYLLGRKEANFEKVDLHNLALKTEGFLMQDLRDLVDKVIFEAYKSAKDLDADKELIVGDDLCEIALSNAQTLSLREVQLHSPGERDFGDVGGLDDVKKILVETMLWPAQYASIFDNSPLRLQSGVLLYGPPGTGKTMLAGAAARQCNLRLISVKGPELLSKYIGASEQSVRDVFQKAQSAKPCILFFDEFDSLAPRRGHDNTGVTDRVVNQFLTQLDGVESLSGVCVLAATSRPDLLDPALLRPGRLDRQILCPMPDQPSRLSVLKSLSKKLPLAKDAKLERIAEETEGFSGADLQAVLYTAQLNSVDHLLRADCAPRNAKAEPQSVTQEHLVAALKSTRPSLTKDERLKYERIYQKFQGKSDVLESLKLGKQKATLA